MPGNDRWLPEWARHCQASWWCLCCNFCMESPFSPSPGTVLLILQGPDQTFLTNSVKASSNLQILLMLLVWNNTPFYGQRISLAPQLGLCVWCIFVFLALSKVPSTQWIFNKELQSYISRKFAASQILPCAGLQHLKFQLIKTSWSSSSPVNMLLDLEDLFYQTIPNMRAIWN